MSWLLGAGMGFFMGGPLGAVVGGVLEHVVTKKSKERILTSSSETTQETIFITNLTALMAKVAMADGHISKEENLAIHRFFAQHLRYKGEELKYIDGIIKETERINPDLEKICHSFRQYAPMESRLLLLELTYQIAAIDHVITNEEQHEINTIASLIGISQENHHRIKIKYSSKTQKENPYTLLGLNPGASPADIKKAYRQMATQYHPDKVSHLGKELIDFANKKFKEINKSYEILKKENNF